jgi:hypothetical protein
MYIFDARKINMRGLTLMRRREKIVLPILKFLQFRFNALKPHEANYVKSLITRKNQNLSSILRLSTKQYSWLCDIAKNQGYEIYDTKLWDEINNLAR